MVVEADELDGARDLALQARGVFKQFCHRCHHGEGSEGGSFDVLVDKTLSGKSEETGKAYIVPGKPEESFILERVSKGQMPPKAIRERPSEAELRRRVVQGVLKPGRVHTRLARSRPLP